MRVLFAYGMIFCINENFNTPSLNSLDSIDDYDTKLQHVKNEEIWKLFSSPWYFSAWNYPNKEGNKNLLTKSKSINPIRFYRFMTKNETETSNSDGINGPLF